MSGIGEGRVYLKLDPDLGKHILCQQKPLMIYPLYALPYDLHKKKMSNKVTSTIVFQNIYFKNEIRTGANDQKIIVNNICQNIMSTTQNVTNQKQI